MKFVLDANMPRSAKSVFADTDEVVPEVTQSILEISTFERFKDGFFSKEGLGLTIPLLLAALIPFFSSIIPFGIKR